MAVAARSVASLMRKTLDRQNAVVRQKIRFRKGQVEQILISYISDEKAGPYNELVKVVQDYPLTDENFRILIEDCTSCVVLLGRELKLFVEALCNVEWASRDEELVETYSRFVMGLVTAHTYHCPRVMTSLIKLFKGEGENWEESPPEETNNQWSNIHTIIAQIVAIMPLTSDLLMQTVIAQFPYYKAGCFANRAYVHNLIWISRYLPSLREQIMVAIINRMVIMDTNIVDRSKSKLHLDTMFEMEVDGEETDVCHTLDYCMLEMLSWLQDERGPVLEAMCNVFERMVLPTHGIRFVQFLLLYTVSISQQCADRVLANLWLVAAGLHGLGPGAVATRRTAASHLAGLLARCVRVPNTRLIKYLRSMAEWCHSYITATQEASSASDSTKFHGAFHAVCHAIFYLVAFKHHHLFSSKENINFVESLNLPRLVTCSLNPLRTCPPQVTRQFSATTRAHQVVYCQAIVEKNARHCLQNPEVGYDEWFPYDPYTLPKSGKIIWPLCTEFKDWSKDGDETQYAGMKRKLDADDDDYLMEERSQQLASSLSNCISPGFKTTDNIAI